MKYTGVCFYQSAGEWCEVTVTDAVLNGPNLSVDWREADGSLGTLQAFADDAVHFRGQYRYPVSHGELLLKAFRAPDGEVLLFGTWTNTSAAGRAGRWGFKLTPVGGSG